MLIGPAPHLQDPSAIQAAHTSTPAAVDFNAMSFLSSKGKGKPIAGVASHTTLGRNKLCA